jgi:type IV pilus assembly protein PilM
MGDFFALDLGTNAVRVVQLSGSGARSSLQHYGYATVESSVMSSDSADARRRLGDVIMTAIGQSGIKSRDVVIGLPSNKTFTTVVDVPITTDAELKATMKYQVDQFVPASIDETKVDWAKLGPSLRAEGQQEVLISSVANSFVEDRFEFIESLGFNVLAAEPDPIAMVRALVPPGNHSAILLLDMGENSTDIAVVHGDSPRLVRTIPTGLNSFVKAAVQNLNVQEDQARQFILKFGLAPDRLDGQVLHALESTLTGFATEMTKSIKFFQTRYANVTIDTSLVSGYAAVIPRLNDYLAAQTAIQTQNADPWRTVQMSQAMRDQIAPVAHEFATVVGLAMRSDGS